jgi:prophage antirepressor-like protein
MAQLTESRDAFPPPCRIPGCTFDISSLHLWLDDVHSNLVMFNDDSSVVWMHALPLLAFMGMLGEMKLDLALVSDEDKKTLRELVQNKGLPCQGQGTASDTVDRIEKRMYVNIRGLFVLICASNNAHAAKRVWSAIVKVVLPDLGWMMVEHGANRHRAEDALLPCIGFDASGHRLLLDGMICRIIVVIHETVPLWFEASPIVTFLGWRTYVTQALSSINEEDKSTFKELAGRFTISKIESVYRPSHQPFPRSWCISDRGLLCLISKACNKVEAKGLRELVKGAIIPEFGMRPLKRKQRVPKILTNKPSINKGKNADHQLYSAIAQVSGITLKDVERVLQGLHEVGADILKQTQQLCVPGMVLVKMKTVPARAQSTKTIIGKELILKARPATKKLTILECKQFKDLVLPTASSSSGIG